MSGTLTSVFCIVRQARRPALRAMPPGLPGGGPVRLLDAGDGIWLVVSSLPAADYDAPAIEEGLRDLDWVSARALAHEAVVERFLRATALLPLPLFTIFASDARALASVTRRRARVQRLLDRVEGRLEWGVRVTVDRARPLQGSRAAPRSGTSYLTEKREAWQGRPEQARAATRAASRLYRALAGVAAGAVRRPIVAGPSGTPVLLDAAFLVPAREGGTFRRILGRETRALADDGMSVTCSGPWPAYHFSGGR